MNSLHFVGAQNQIELPSRQEGSSKKRLTSLEQNQSVSHTNNESNVSSMASVSLSSYQIRISQARGRHGSDTTRTHESTECFTPQFTSTQELNSQMNDEFLYSTPTLSYQRGQRQSQRDEMDANILNESDIITSTQYNRYRPNLNNHATADFQRVSESGSIQVINNAFS